MADPALQMCFDVTTWMYDLDDGMWLCRRLADLTSRPTAAAHLIAAGPE